MIPKYLKEQLDETEIKMAEDFIKECKFTFDDYDEDCCMTSPYHFEVYTSGIGDTIWIVGKGKRLALLSEERIANL